MPLTYTLISDESTSLEIFENKIRTKKVLTEGTYNYSIRATDDKGWSKIYNGVFTVGIVTIISGTPSDGYKDQPFSFTPTVTGTTGTPTFSITGSLPTGLNFSTSTGTISGTPTVTGTFSGITVRVTDSRGNKSLSITLKIIAGSQLDFSKSSNSGLLTLF